MHQNKKFIIRVSALAIRYAVLLFLTFIFFAPVVFILSGALKVSESMYSSPYRWFPAYPSLDNFRYILNEFGILRYMRNSLIVTSLTTVLQCIVCSLAGFGFGKMRFPGKNSIFLLCTGTLMIPFTSLLIPMFIMMNYVGWVDTFLPLIIPTAFTYTYGVFIFRQFTAGIPDELLESAYIDGCRSLRIFTSIVLPLIKPAFVTVAILGALGSWNDYLNPLIYLNSVENYTAQLALGFFSGQFSAAIQYLLAAVFITILPIIALYFLIQRYFIQSIMTSGIKS